MSNEGKTVTSFVYMYLHQPCILYCL